MRVMVAPQPFTSSASWAELVSGLNSRPRKRGFISIRASSEKGNKDNKPMSFADKLLDYIEGGPKLRKWYGAQDQFQLNDAEEAAAGEEESTTGDVRDAVLVTDADSETGQLVVLSLILKRSRVRVLVRDEKLAVAAFASYVEPVVGNVYDRSSLMKACKGVRAIVCPTKVGALADKALLKGVEHFVYLSELASLRRSKGLDFLLRSGARRQAMEDEAAVAALGIPYTILRPASLRDEPGGQLGFEIHKVDLSSDSKVVEDDRSISREDAAMLCVKALDAPPQPALVLEVANANSKATDLEAVFSSLSSESK